MTALHQWAEELIKQPTAKAEVFHDEYNGYMHGLGASYVILWLSACS